MSEFRFLYVVYIAGADDEMPTMMLINPATLEQQLEAYKQIAANRNCDFLTGINADSIGENEPILTVGAYTPHKPSGDDILQIAVAVRHWLKQVNQWYANGSADAAIERLLIDLTDSPLGENQP